MTTLTCQHADGHECALLLPAGTLILPVDELQAAEEEGWVSLFWQGDSRRRCGVIGTRLAALRCAGMSSFIESVSRQRNGPRTGSNWPNSCTASPAGRCNRPRFWRPCPAFR